MRIGRRVLTWFTNRLIDYCLPGRSFELLPLALLPDRFTRHATAWHTAFVAQHKPTLRQLHKLYAMNRPQCSLLTFLYLPGASFGSAGPSGDTSRAGECTSSSKQIRVGIGEYMSHLSSCLSSCCLIQFQQRSINRFPVCHSGFT